MKKIALALTAWTAAAACFADEVPSEVLENWPRWRGPLATGVAPLGNPPTHWDEDTNIKWKIKLPGDSTATPVVWGEKIFLTTAIETDREGEPEKLAEAERKPPRAGSTLGFSRAKPPTHFYEFVVMCLDRATGNTLWRDVAKVAVPHEGHHPDGSFASASCCTDGRIVCASFGSRGIYCYDVDGHQKWSRDLGRMRVFNTFGEGTSPVIYGDAVVVNWDHQGESFVICLDAETGDTRWKVGREENSSWATPLVVDTGDRPQVVVHGSARVRSYDLKTGELLWACGGQGPSAIPSPVTDRSRVYAMTGFITNSLYAIPLDSVGDITKQDDKIAWKTRKVGTPYVPSPLLWDDLLYFTAGNKGILSCYDAATGEPIVDRQRLQGIANVYASPVGAADKIYVTSREGTTVVIPRGKFVEEDGKQRVEILATNKLDDSFDASATIVGDELFLRGKTHLYCIAEE
ncbi:MAG: hypothetical protein DWQ37_17570 [Planctomycetota bacterium]|nr:MAG: hypothetical protein DWQ37_17570 [Planctomycetota bacterium]